MVGGALGCRDSLLFTRPNSILPALFQKLSVFPPHSPNNAVVRECWRASSISTPSRLTWQQKRNSFRHSGRIFVVEARIRLYSGIAGCQESSAHSYSNLSACIGSTLAALLAGMKQANTAIT